MTPIDRIVRAICAISRLQARAIQARKAARMECACDEPHKMCTCIPDRLRQRGKWGWHSPRERDLWRREIWLREQLGEHRVAAKYLYAAEAMERGYVEVTFESTRRRDGIQLPKRLRGKRDVALIFGSDLPIPIPDLTLDERGIGGTLSFKGRPYPCWVPWTVVYAIDGEDGRGTYWREDLPALPASERQATLDLTAKTEADEELVFFGPVEELVFFGPRTWQHDRFLEESRVRRERFDRLIAELDARPPAPPPEPERTLGPGDKVILSRTDHAGWSVGMPRGPWTVVACECGLCAAGSHVAIDVPHSDAFREMYPDSGPWKHVAAFWLRRRGELSRTQADAWCEGLACNVGQAIGQAGEIGDVRVFAREVATLMFVDAIGSVEEAQRKLAEAGQ